MNNTTSALVLLSGGQDSTTCLYYALNTFDRVSAISIYYGQKHSKEVERAAEIFSMAKNRYGTRLVSHEEVVLPDSILSGSSPLINEDEELQTYKDYNSLPGGLERTYVPLRNLLFLTIAANRAFVADIGTVVIGVSEEDFGGYPDCRAAFLKDASKAINSGLPDESFLSISTPLIYKSKKETVEMALDLEGCLEALAKSITCYAGEVPGCGKCHSCLLRKKGFEEAGVPDPIYK